MDEIELSLQEIVRQYTEHEANLTDTITELSKDTYTPERVVAHFAGRFTELKEHLKGEGEGLSLFLLIQAAKVKENLEAGKNVIKGVHEIYEGVENFTTAIAEVNELLHLDDTEAMKKLIQKLMKKYGETEFIKDSMKFVVGHLGFDQKEQEEIAFWMKGTGAILADVGDIVSASGNEKIGGHVKFAGEVVTKCAGSCIIV